MEERRGEEVVQADIGGDGEDDRRD
jgi:hypothetical protein